MNANISKFDKILIPFLNLHFKHGLIKTISKIYKTIFDKLIVETKKQATPFLNIIYIILFGILSVILTFIYIPIYLVIYILTSVIIIGLSSIQVLVTAILFGLCPFLLENKRTNDPVEDETPRERVSSKLLLPISWTIGWNKVLIRNMFNIGTRPALKLKDLNNDKNETHILERVALIIASVISFTIYVILISTVTWIISNIFLIVIVVLSVLLWCIVKIFTDVLFKLFSSNDDSDDLDEGGNV